MIIYSGILIDKWSKSYKRTDGSTAYSATIVLQTGNYQDIPIYMSFETNNSEIIDKIKEIKEKEKIEVSGYLNCNYGISKKTGNKYAILKINIKEIKKVNENISEIKKENIQNQGNENIVISTDDLPF